MEHVRLAVYFFLEMYEYGFVMDAWDRHLTARDGDNVCSREEFDAEDGQPSQTFDLQQSPITWAVF